MPWCSHRWWMRAKRISVTHTLNIRKVASRKQLFPCYFKAHFLSLGTPRRTTYKIMNIQHKQRNVQLLWEGACSAWPCRKCAYNSKHSRCKRQETAWGLGRMEKYQWHWPDKSNLDWIVQIINGTIRILQLSSILLCTILITCQSSSACVHQCDLLKCCFSAMTDYYRQKEVSPTAASLRQTRCKEIFPCHYLPCLKSVTSAGPSSYLPWYFSTFD